MPRDRSDYFRVYQREWVAERRRKAINLLGGKCVWCDAEDDLHFDHIRPSTKDPLLNGGSYSIPFNWAWPRVLAELEKCQLLCRECHRIKTRDDRPEALHGTAGMYHSRKCRCRECKDWMAASKRDYRARKQLGVV